MTGIDNANNLTLISHYLCPFVQRAVISLTEKQVAFERVYIDLANKPEWFLALSPLGKTPVLKVGETPIFESAVILEYLEETQPHPLHPAGPLERAQHRSWMEFGSATLSDISGFYTAADEAAFIAKSKALRGKFERLETRLGGGPYFDGERFSLVDAVFAPAFRYFDVLDRIGDFGIWPGLSKVPSWRNALAARPSVKAAVTEDYETRLMAFLKTRPSHLSSFMKS